MSDHEHGPGCGHSRWAELTDRPTTEPRTEAGKALAAKAKREGWSNWEGLAQFTIPAIETEAAQGAAPSVDELDVDILRQAMNEAGLGVPYHDAAPIEVSDVQNVIAWYHRLSGAPQEGRAECKRFRHDEHCDH